MEIFKLFPNKVTQFDGQSNIEPSINVVSYVFSVVWNAPEQCTLFMLQGRTAAGSWHPIITNPIVDNDGEISVKIGDFDPGTDIELMFGIQALTDIENMVTLVTNRTSNISVQFKPSTESKKLPRTETWQETGLLTLI
jgi:hypothetical protein